METFPPSSPDPPPRSSSASPSPPPPQATTVTATATTTTPMTGEPFASLQQQPQESMQAPPSSNTVGIRDRSHSTPPSNLLSSLAAAMASSPSPTIPAPSLIPTPLPAPHSRALRPNTSANIAVFTSLDDDHPTSLASIAAHKRKSRSIGNIHALQTVSENVVSVSPTNDNDPLGRRRSSVASNISSNALAGVAGAASGSITDAHPPPLPSVPFPTAYSNTLPRSPSDGLRSSSNRPVSVMMDSSGTSQGVPAAPEHHVSLSPEEPPKPLSSDDIPAVPPSSAAVLPLQQVDAQGSNGPQDAKLEATQHATDETEDVGASTTNLTKGTMEQQEPSSLTTGGTLAKMQRRFQRHFPALASETVISAHSCSMEKMNKEEHWIGRMYITDRHLCFQGKLDKYIAKVNVRYSDVISVQSLRDDVSATGEEGSGAKTGPVVGVKVMSLVSKYSFSHFQHGHVPIQEIRTQWQATQSHAAALQQASQRRLDILMRPPSIVAPAEPPASSSSQQAQLCPPAASNNASSTLGAPSPARPLPIPKPSPARSTTTMAAPSSTTAMAVLVAPESKHLTQSSATIVMTHPIGYNLGLSASRPSTSSGSISTATSIPTLSGIAPIGGTPPIPTAPAAIVNGGALVVPAPSVPAPLPPVAQTNGNGSSSSMQISTVPSMEATAGTAGTAFRGFFNRMVKSKRSESATGSGSMSTSNNAAVMAAAAAAVAAGPPAPSSASVTKVGEKGGTRDVASSSDLAFAQQADATTIPAKPAAPSKPVKRYSPSCPCTSLTPLKHTVLAPILVPTSAKQVWLALFGPSAPVYQSAHKTRETERMDLPQWPEPNSNDVPVVGTERTVSYRISFYLPLKGKQSADSTETQKVVSVAPVEGSTSPTAWIVEYSTKTPDVPSGGSFTTQARVCVNQVGPNKTSIHVQFAVNFHEKVRFIQGQIEQGGVDGCTALWKEIAQGLKSVPPDAEDMESASTASPPVGGSGPLPAMDEPIVIEAPASEGLPSVSGSAMTSPSKIGGSHVASGPAVARRQPLVVLNAGSVIIERVVRMVVSKPRKLKKYLLFTAIIMTLVNALYAVWLAGQVVSLLPELSTGVRSATRHILLPSTAATPTTTAPVDKKDPRERPYLGKDPGEIVKAPGQKDATAILLDTWSKSLQARAESLQAELSALRAAAAVVGGSSGSQEKSS